MQASEHPHDQDKEAPHIPLTHRSRYAYWPRDKGRRLFYQWDLKTVKADLHPLLEIPTLKVSNEFDRKSVEGRPAQEKEVNSGVGNLAFAHQQGYLSWAIHID